MEHVLKPSGPVWGRFGAVLGQMTPCAGGGTRKIRPKGTPHVAQVDYIPRHGRRTPPAPKPEPSGHVWGRMGPFKAVLGLFWGRSGVKLANDRSPRAENAGEVQFLAPLLG